MVNTITNYEYITGSQRAFLESNIPEKISIIQDSLLEFKSFFESMDWTRGELERIARELESMGKYFAEQQGLYETGELIKGIKADVLGTRVRFFNSAQNSRHQYYAGHLEYGYYSKSGRFIEARPFMRPALFAVSKASQGDFSNLLAELARGAFRADGTGYQGLSNLTFGHHLGEAYRFSQQTNIIRNNIKTPSGSHSKYFLSELSNAGTALGKNYSIRRGRHDSSTVRKKNDVFFRDSKNQSNGRNIRRAKEVSQARRVGERRSRIKRVIYKPNQRVPVTRRHINLEYGKPKNIWRASDGTTSSNRGYIEKYQYTKFKNSDIERIRVIPVSKASYSSTKGSGIFSYKKRK